MYNEIVLLYFSFLLFFLSPYYEVYTCTFTIYNTQNMPKSSFATQNPPLNPAKKYSNPKI